MGQLPEALKDVENHIKYAQKKSPKSDNCTTVIEPPVQNNYSQDTDEFLVGCTDILENNHSSRQTRGSAVIFSAKLSNLPEISEENLPKWKRLKKNRKYKCFICGNPRMKKDRYDDYL